MRAVGALVVLPLFAGCVPYCVNEDVYRPRVATPGDGKVEALQTHLVVDLNSLGTLRVAECGRSGAEPKAGPMKLCLLVRVEDQHQFQFQSPRIRVTSDAGASHDLSIGKLSYKIFSLYQPDGSERPDSSPAAPTAAPLEIDRGQRHGSGRTDRYSFD